MRIALAGLGITGKQVAEYILDQPELALVSAIVKPHSVKIGIDVGEILGRKAVGTTAASSADLAEILSCSRPQVLLDFSSPAFIHDHVEELTKAGVNLVIATTGHNAVELQRLKYYTNKYRTSTVIAPNITYGVNAFIELCKHAAKLMGGYDFEIIESHHRHKKDSPSGTAKRIAASIIGHSSPQVDSTGSEIPIHSIRAGGIIGDHKVVICGPYDKIELRHESFSRKVFAQGALWAADFITKHRGFFHMEDVFAQSLLGTQVSTCANCNNIIDTQSNYVPNYN